MSSNYIYLLQEREFIKTNENIYKVGMTTKENYERFNQYPKGSRLLFQTICNDCKEMEKNIIAKFKKTFKQKKEIGNEYFEGDYKDMINIIYSTIKNEENVIDINDVELEENEVNDNIEDDVEVPIYLITTYEEWIKFNNINKIIITNRRREEGFLKFKGQLWRKLFDKNNLEDEETLLGYIEYNQNDFICKHKITGEVIIGRDISMDEMHYYDYGFDIKYDVDKILKDTLNKCYIKKYDSYNLNYNDKHVIKKIEYLTHERYDNYKQWFYKIHGS